MGDGIDADLEERLEVAAALGSRRQFRTFDGMLHAVDNRDPFSGQIVLSRGIVGSSVSIAVHDVRRNGVDVEVRTGQ